jgi:hypothetical protein
MTPREGELDTNSEEESRGERSGKVYAARWYTLPWGRLSEQCAVAITLGALHETLMSKVGTD